MENILTLGKLLSLWFCFLLHSILFFISQTSYRTYKIISSYDLARPVMGTIFLVIIIMNKSQELTIFHRRQKLSSAMKKKARKVMVDFKFDALYS